LHILRALQQEAVALGVSVHLVLRWVVLGRTERAPGRAHTAILVDNMLDAALQVPVGEDPLRAIAFAPDIEVCLENFPRAQTLWRPLFEHVGLALETIEVTLVRVMLDIYANSARGKCARAKTCACASRAVASRIGARCVGFLYMRVFSVTHLIPVHAIYGSLQHKVLYNRAKIFSAMEKNERPEGKQTHTNF